MFRLVIAALVLTTTLACARGLSGVRRSPDSPETFALLINGGGNPKTNYASHAFHLQGIHEVLRSRGIAPQNIWVLASDGASPQPDLAVAHPAEGADAWRLEGTILEQPLGHAILHANTKLEELSPWPARRADLERWFSYAGETLRPNDTLLVFVTDHGVRGKTPDKTRIVLWNRQSITVKKLAAQIAKLDPRVRVVLVMGQCFSGAFAELALELNPGRRNICGFFSTTADRPAFGCSPESIASRSEGYLLRLIEGLMQSESIEHAHRATQLTDRAPDVPIATSDVFLSRFLEKNAAAKHAPLSREDTEEMRRIRAIAASFALPMPSASSELAALRGRLTDLTQRLEDADLAWNVAIGDLTQANLDAFLETRPDWRTKVTPRALARLDPPELASTQATFVKELGAFVAKRSPNHAASAQAHVRELSIHAAALRSDARAAAALRLETQLTSLAARDSIAREGTPSEREQLAALDACEDFVLPTAGPLDELPARAPIPFPPIESDEHADAALAPGSLGAVLAPPPPHEKELPVGAMVIASVESGSPAERAGLRIGDAILGAPGDPVVERGAMKLFLALRGVEHERPLEIMRDGQRLEISATMRAKSRPPEARDLPAAGRAALDRLRAFRGPELALGDGKRHMLFFWATWCTYCKDAVAELRALEEKRGVAVVAITTEGVDLLDPFFRNWRGPFPEAVAIDADGEANAAFHVEGYPTFVLMDEKGRVAMRAIGYSKENGIPLEGWKY